MSEKLKRCPLLNKECITTKCMWWADMVVRDVATQNVRNEGNCAISVLPMILAEQNKNTLGVQAAVESNRNETCSRQDASIQLQNLLLGMVKRPRELPGDSA